MTGQDKTMNVAEGWAQELYLGAREDKTFKRQRITSGSDAEKYARQFYGEDISIYESCFIMLLNQRHDVIGWVKISQGGCAATVIDVRLVAKYAVECLAAAVIMVHNHPSGNLMASSQDDNISRRVKDGLATLDVKLLDSIIIAPSRGYYSYTDQGRL